MDGYLGEAIKTALNNPRDWRIALLVLLFLIVIGLITGYAQRFIDWLFRRKGINYTYKSSSNVSAGKGIRVGGDIIVGGQKTQVVGEQKPKAADVKLSVSCVTRHRNPARHEYQLKIVATNNSNLSLGKPKLAITLPSQVLGTVSSRAKKTIKGRIVQIYFEELDVETIHPGEEEKVLMETPNVGLYYFMDSNLHDDSFVMNQNITVELFADGIEPIVVSKSFKEMHEF